MAHIEYPFEVNTMTREEHILRDFNYYVNMYVLSPRSLEAYMEENLTEISLTTDQVKNITGMPEGVTQQEVL